MGQLTAIGTQATKHSSEEANMHPIRVGTCGWSCKDWAGTFYPKGTAAGDYLPAYAEQYKVVEVDSTFYHSPGRKLVEGWRDRTPEGFGFSLKVPQAITHEKVLQDCSQELNAFLAAARVLEEKLACCLLQFGYFNKKAFASLDAFLERLDPILSEWPKDVPVAVEVRNKTWVVPKLVECLRNHQVVMALVDQVWMPSPLSVLKNADVVTGPFGYVRLLGDRAEVDRLTKTLDHVVIDRGDQIRADAHAIQLLAQRVPVLAFVNNHFAGYAPETVQELVEALA
jgi:uncharacterized protein YecE (DUF72 family)